MRFSFRGREITFDGTCLMGIVNVTPDSFSDGGNFLAPETALVHGLKLYRDGAAIIDIGGESTRPDAPEVNADEEIARIIPVISALKREVPEIIISVDTRKAPVALAAVRAGADIINDVSGLQYSPEIAEIAAKYAVGLVIMHMRGTPRTMQEPENLQYRDLIGEIVAFLENAARKAREHGVKKENIILDPGIGFSKDAEQNLEIIRKIERFRECGYAVLAGHSRKSFIGKLLQRDNAGERLAGTLAVSLVLAARGVDILRVHDVRETHDALQMYRFCV
ncbi:MAG: dihydropteroate synthase [Victivallales bacterium]|nr:dihydropteroate synthase [Victivallales bacterium]